MLIKRHRLIGMNVRTSSFAVVLNKAPYKAAITIDIGTWTEVQHPPAESCTNMKDLIKYSNMEEVAEES